MTTKITDDEIKDLRERHEDDPDDIVARLLAAAETAPLSEAPLLLEAAQTIDNMRNGYGG